MDMLLEPTDLDPQETREWLDAMQAVVAARRPAARALPAGSAGSTRTAGAGRYAAPNTTPHINTIPVSAQDAFPGDTGSGTAAGRLSALERHGHGAARRQDLGRGRAHRHLCVGDHAGETGYRHFFRAATPEFLGDMLYIQAIRRPASTRAPTWKAACRKTSWTASAARSAAAGWPRIRTRALCRALAVPDRVDGPGPADGRLPGALHALPGRPRADSRAGPQGLGIPGRRRAGPARDAGRRGHGRPREASTTRSSWSIATCNAWTAGARQRQDHAGAGKRVSRRRLERDQGGLGRRLGRAAGPGP